MRTPAALHSPGPAHAGFEPVPPRVPLERVTVPTDVMASDAASDEDVHCARCDAVCCRLTVVLQPEDRIAEHLTTVTDQGLHVMARDAEGWCVAVDAARMCCSIYEARPSVCRRFRMGGPYCQAIREDYSGLHLIPSTLIEDTP